MVIGIMSQRLGKNQLKRILDEFRTVNLASYMSAENENRRINDANNLIPELFRVLEYKDSESRQLATKILGHIGLIVPLKVDFIIPELLKIIKNDKSENVRSSAAWALGIMQAKTTIGFLREDVSDTKKSENERFEFALALLRLEGIGGIGEKVINEMNDRLDNFQKNQYNSVKTTLISHDVSAHISRLEIIKGEVTKVQEESITIKKKADEQLESTAKNELVSLIGNQQATINSLHKEVDELSKSLNNFIRESREIPRLSAEELGNYADAVKKFAGSKSWWAIFSIQFGLVLIDIFIEMFVDTLSWQPWLNIGYFLAIAILIVFSILSVKGKI